MTTRDPLRVRWLGRVQYRDALALQRALVRRSRDDYLLLLEHAPIYTLGARARSEHVLDEVPGTEAELVRVDRGGEATFHGPGQLVGYPILSLPMGSRAIPRYVAALEDLVIRVCREFGLVDVGRRNGFPGVWVEPDAANARKICAIGVRVSHGRTMHGFAFNVNTDLSMFTHIVPCGIADRSVTSLKAEGIDASMPAVIDAVVRCAKDALSLDGVARDIDRQDAAWADAMTAEVTRNPTGRPVERRLKAAGVAIESSVRFGTRKPEWLRVEARMGDEYLVLRRRMRTLDLVTVCEEAGCPNIYECWSDGTATFMINGERCTRACGFCLVDTSHPLPIDPDEPNRVAQAVAQMGLSHAVVTAVARDDLVDGGALAFAQTIEAIRQQSRTSAVEVLIPDCKGDPAALKLIFDARPDVLNHNLETVLRLQRAVRPSASYARSLAVLSRAKSEGLTTKSGLILGMGETDQEVIGALEDLASVGVDIVTVGQYLRPSAAHLPIARYVTPQGFAEIAERARQMGFRHVVALPLARSSYHARQAAESSDRSVQIA